MANLRVKFTFIEQLIKEPIIWKLVSYVKSLPVPASVPTQAW